MKMNGAEALLACLQAEGVDTVFGFPGGAVLHIYDALLQSPIRHILTRHEQGAAHAADGYARATGKVGVCIATSGPGATNLVTGIANAYLDSVPLVAITGQVATGMIGTDSFQEVDITGITAPVTKHNYLIKDVNELPRVVKEAFHIARTGRPGPVLIDIPIDVTTAAIDFDYPETVDLAGYKPTEKGHPLQIERVLQAIQEAQRPVICAGGGVISAGAAAELRELAERRNIPVITTMMGIGAIPTDHPLALGMVGLHGLPAANRAITGADLLIAVGVRFGDRVTRKISGFAPRAKVVHIDIDPAEIGKNIRVSIPVVGDIKNILAALGEVLPAGGDTTAWVEQVRQWKADWCQATEPANGKVKPKEVFAAINAVTGGDAIITTEVGEHQMWAAQCCQCQAPRTFLSSGGLGTMGYGLPAAVGAQIGRPDKLVINISGDGSFQMNMQELATAVENDLPLKIIVFNNAALGMVRQLQEFYCEGRYSQVLFKFVPDFAGLAAAYGAKGIRIDRPEEVRPAIEAAISHPGLVIVDCRIDPVANVLPMVPNGAALNEMIGG